MLPFFVVGFAALLVHSVVVSLKYRNAASHRDALKEGRRISDETEEELREQLRHERAFRLAEMERLNKAVIDRNALLTSHNNRWARIVFGKAKNELLDMENLPPVSARYELRRVRFTSKKAAA